MGTQKNSKKIKANASWACLGEGIVWFRPQIDD